MQINWPELKERSETITQKLLNPSLDVQQRQELQREHAHVSTLLKMNGRIEELQQALVLAQQELAKNQETEMAELYQEEIATISQELKEKNQELEDTRLLLILSKCTLIMLFQRNGT